MNKEFFLIGLSLILTFLTACTRNLEPVSESQSIEPKEPIQSKEIKPSQIISIEPTVSSQSSEPEYLTHPYERGQFSWTPDGKYFVCIHQDGFDLYNTDNQLEKHTFLSKEFFFERGDSYWQ